MPKIMISEFIGLYQTIDRLTSPSTHFPFVVDLPRSFKSNNRSGKYYHRVYKLYTASDIGDC